MAKIKRLLHPFVLVLSAMLALAYAYIAARLTTSPPARVLLAIPFLLVWILPVVYWAGGRPERGRVDHFVTQGAYLSMGWLSFILVATLLRDLALALATWTGWERAAAVLEEHGSRAALLVAAVGMAWGVVQAMRGPALRRVVITVPGLHPDLVGLRIAQVSDLHVGPTIRRPYVEKTVALVAGAKPDLIALTGDIVDGRRSTFQSDAAPLGILPDIAPCFFVVGNHEYYCGLPDWTEFFESIGARVLANSHAAFVRGQATVLVGGVLDPAARLLPGGFPGAGDGPDPARALRTGDLGATPQAAFKLLLAHNPKAAPAAAAAGFALQLSGHTHGGQFFPWMLVTHLVHAPHHVGLSRSGGMWVYVSAGTGSWGPPIRFGTQPEVTLIELAAAPGST
jgi:predicted MPP superfamily phosphohydrolase